jgi:hypothetical protein
MDSKTSSAQKSLIRPNEPSARPASESVQSPRRRVSWGNQIVRTFFKDDKTHSNREPYNLIEPGAAENPICSSEYLSNEPMLIDQDFSMSSNLEGIPSPEFGGRYEGPQVVRMNCEDSPVDEASLSHDQGVAGRYVRQLEDTPLQSRAYGLTPVPEVNESQMPATSDDSEPRARLARYSTDSPIFSSFQQLPSEQRRPLQEISSMPHETAAALSRPSTTKALAAEAPREYTETSAQSRPETPRKYISSRTPRRSSHRSEAKDTSNLPSAYERELKTPLKLVFPKFKRPRQQTPARLVSLMMPSDYEAKIKLMCEEYHKETELHRKFTEDVHARTDQLHDEVRRLAAEVALLEQNKRGSEEIEKTMEAVLNSRTFSYFLRELEILKDIAGWELIHETDRGNVRHFKRTSTRNSQHLYGRYKLQVLHTPASAVLSYSTCNDFADSVLATVFPNVQKSFSFKVQGWPEALILEEALKTVEGLVEFIANMERLTYIFGNFEQFVSGDFVITELIFTDSVTIRVETDDCLRSFVKGRQVSLHDTSTLMQ